MKELYYRRNIRKYLEIIIVFFIFPCLCNAQEEGGKLSFYVTPGISLPLGETTTSLFTLGGGAEVSGFYTFPKAPALCIKGAIDYSLLPTVANTNLSFITFSGGPGILVNPLPWLSFHIVGSGGYGLAVYSGTTGGSAFVAGEGGITFNFVPAFGMGASVAYRHYFSQPTALYQGLRVNLGAMIHLGAEKTKANIDIPSIRIDPVFPIFFKHYDDHPIGAISLHNTEKGPIQDISVSYFTPQYMDKPKECAVIEVMKQGETKEIPLYALFNDKVLSITEGTKVSGEITVTYKYAKREFMYDKADTMRLYDRNAMTWDDDRKAAAFVTAKDPEILKFSKQIAGLVREHQSTALTLPFRIGIGMFEGMGVYGIRYVVDPKSPYTEFSENAASVDYLQFPVQTLAYAAGDCDDLSICYCAMLESVGIETAFITVPGHIFAAFSPGISQEDAKKTFQNQDNLIFINDQTWIPVEITMIKDGFIKAWEQGAKEWREASGAGTAYLYPLHDAWTQYEPVGLPASSEAIQLPDTNSLLAAFDGAITKLVEREIADKVAELTRSIKENNNSPKIMNKLGVLYGQFGLLDKAKEQFELASDAGYIPAKINLGNLLFLSRDFSAALGLFDQVKAKEPDNVNALLGIAKVSFEIENFGTAKAAYDRIKQKDPKLAEQVRYLVSATTEEGRASAADDRFTVYWYTEE